MLTTLILFAVFSPSSGAPLKAIRKCESCSGVDDQDVRTVQDIVWGCVATIFACTWAALHPNLPDPRSSGWSRFKHRIRVVIIAVFVPELILIWALRQRIGAASIMREYNRTILEIDEDQRSFVCRVREWFHVQPQQNNCPSWTLTHGFYVQMGGFLLYNKDTPLRVLYFRQLLKLIRVGLVDRPNISEEDIRDRSKGDFFTKAFVVAQTTWFIAQCAARWVARLPVTELEVMTLAFAVLNIITYWLWWEKPQNVSIGVRVQLKEEEMCLQDLLNTGGREDLGKEDLSDIVFYHSINGTVFTTEEVDGTDSSRRQGQQDMNATLTWPDTEGIDIMIGFSRIGDSQGADTLDAWPSVDVTNSGGNVRAFEDNFKPIVTDHTIGGSLSGQETDGNTQSNLLTNAIPHPCPRDSIWARAVVLAKEFMSVLKCNLYRRLKGVVIGLWPLERRTVSAIEVIISSPGALNIRTFYAYDIPTSQGFKPLISAVACGTLFGGLHLIPWTFVFPTHAESLLWRITSLYITLSPVILSLPMVIFSLYFSQPTHNRRGTIFIMGLVPLYQVITATLPLYFLARIVIIVLAFTTLHSLPPDTYKEIPWSSFIPHI